MDEKCLQWSEKSVTTVESYMSRNADGMYLILQYTDKMENGDDEQPSPVVWFAEFYGKHGGFYFIGDFLEPEEAKRACEEHASRAR